MKIRLNARLAALGLAAAFSGVLCQAEPVWICAVTEASATHEDAGTAPLDLGKLAKPTFLKVDANAKQVTILAPAERKGETTRIQTVQKEEKNWLLTGIERGRAWSLVISEDGPMTLSATGDGVVWSIFGQAIPEADLTPRETRNEQAK